MGVSPVAIRNPMCFVRLRIATGETPILLSLRGWLHATIVKALMAHDAGPDEPSISNGLKPLHLAALRNRVEVIELLLAAG